MTAPVIKTSVLTPEYEAGFDLAFPEKRERRQGRATYVWDPQTQRLVEVGADWEPEVRSVPVVGDQHYWGAQTQDGVDIGSRKKHREYMKATGLTTVDDYKSTWEGQRKERDAFFQGSDQARKREIRETMGRALYEAEKASRR